MTSMKIAYNLVRFNATQFGRWVILKMEAKTSETLLPVYKTRQCHIPEEHNRMKLLTHLHVLAWLLFRR
jgi:hypothetical protein